MGKQCLIDFHLHTEHSPDSEAAMPAVCNAAAEAGLSRIAITDHVEIPALYKDGYDRTAALSYAQAGGMQALFKGRLQVERGIELGEPLHDLEKAELLLDTYDFDFVLGSLHNLIDDVDFYHYDFANADIRSLMDRYFAEVLDMVRWGRFHSLAHLTYPFRYIPEFRGKEDYSPWQDAIDAIFRALAEGTRSGDKHLGSASVYGQDNARFAHDTPFQRAGRREGDRGFRRPFPAGCRMQYCRRA